MESAWEAKCVLDFPAVILEPESDLVYIRPLGERNVKHMSTWLILVWEKSCFLL